MCELAELEFLVCVGVAGVGTESDYTDSDLQLQTVLCSRNRKDATFTAALGKRSLRTCFKLKGKTEKQQLLNN